MTINVGQFAAWTLAAILIGGAAIGVMAFMAWERIRRGHDAAAALARYTQRAVGIGAVPTVVLTLIAAQDPRFWSTHLHLQLMALVWACWFALIVLLLSLRLVIERSVRPPGWSAMAMLQIHLYFLLPLIGTVGVALLGAMMTVWAAGLAGYAVPMWIGPVWLVAATPLVMLAPTSSWLGRRMPLPPDVAELYRQKLQWPDVPEVIALDTRGAHFANAFLFWRPGRRWLAVTDGTLEQLTPAEVMHLMLHETAHYVHQDPRRYFLTLMLVQIAGLAVLAALGWLNLLAAMAAYTLLIATVVTPLTRRAERRADRFVMEQGGDPQIYGEALRKLHAANLLPVKQDDTSGQTHPDLAERLALIGAPISEEESNRAERAAASRPGTVFDLLLHIFLAAVFGLVIAGAGLLAAAGEFPIQEPFVLLILAGNSVLFYTSACKARRALRRLNNKPAGDTRSAVLLALLLTYWMVVYVLSVSQPAPVYLPYAAFAMFVGIWWLVHRFGRRAPVAAPTALQPPDIQTVVPADDEAATAAPKPPMA